MSNHTIMVIKVIKIFLMQFCIFLPPLLDIFCFCWVHTSSAIYCAHLCMKCSLVSLIFLKRSLIFPILLFSSTSLHWLLRNAFLSLLAVLWNSALNGCIFPFLFCLSLLFFSQLFVRPPQTAIFLFCISFSWVWSCSLCPVQCHEPPSIVYQALYQI